MTQPKPISEEPWYIEEIPGGLVISSPSRRIATIRPREGNLDDTDLANAHGMSAVPEMIRALQEFLMRVPLHVPTNLCAFNCDNPIQCGKDYELNIMVAEALTKATGQEFPR